MSKLQVETISHTNNTSGLTIDSSGNVTAPVSIGNVGSIVQTVHGHTTTQVSATSTSLSSPIDSGLAATITPKFSSSKILVCIDASIRGDGTANVNALIKRGGTLIDYSACTDDGILDYAINLTAGNSSWKFYDSPSTSSSTEYRVFFSRYGGSGTAYFNNNGNHYSLSTITLMEIKQ